MNYGALGSVIGHEFSHGFTGWYDSINDWNTGWENDTIEHLRDRAQCIIDEYESYEIANTGTTVSYGGFL